MIVVFCNDWDPSAKLLAEHLNLGRYGLQVLVVDATTLLFGTKLTHTLDRSGNRLKMTFPNGTTVRGDDIQLLINRISYISVPSCPDRDYINQEWLAIFSSICASLSCPVINQPDVYSFLGNATNELALQMAMNAAGLPTTDDFREYYVPSDQFERVFYFHCQGSHFISQPDMLVEATHLSDFLNKNQFELYSDLVQGERLYTGISFLPNYTEFLEDMATCLSSHARIEKLAL